MTKKEVKDVIQQEIDWCKVHVHEYSKDKAGEARAFIKGLQQAKRLFSASKRPKAIPMVIDMPMGDARSAADYMSVGGSDFK